MGAAGAVNDLAITYAPVSTGNQTVLRDGDVIPYPQTLVGNQSTTVIVISNRGSGIAVIQSIAVSGAGFALNNVPSLPAQLTNGQELRLSLIFSPTQAGSFRGTLSLTAVGTQFSFRLEGTGSAPSYKYELLNGSSASELKADGTILFPSAVANSQSSNVQVKVSNTGNAAGAVGNVSLSGNAYQLVNAPIFPVPLSAGQSLTIGLSFSPASVGTIIGRLRIDDAQFALSGVGLGAQISVVLSAGPTAIPISTNGVGLLPNTTVGDQLPLTIQISNSGNQAGDLTFFSLSGAGFAVLQTPSLPVRLAPGDRIQALGVVVPTSPGTLTALLQVNDQAFTLRIVGNQPPVLPAVSFGNLAATLSALQQPSFGISLGSRYPYDLTGKLTLTFAPSSFADDPTIQFASGGRTIDFRVLANSTAAIFAGGASTVGFQTGTTAGTLTFTAAFSVAGFNLTQTSAPSRSATIPTGAPLIRSVEVANRTSSGFQLVITGYSLSRTVTKMDFQFVPATGANLTATKISADVENAFTQWYVSAASLPLGTQFSVTAQFNVSGVLTAIDSVAVSAANAQGVSLTQSVKLN